MNRRGMSPEERHVRDVLIKAGVTPAPDQTGAGLTIAITARITRDMGPDLGKLSIAFRNEMIELLRNATIESPISELYIFPTMLNSEIASMPDFVRHKRQCKEVSVGLNISALDWANSSQIERVNILSKNIRDSISRIKEECLSSLDREVLFEIVEKARIALQSPKRN